MKCANCPRPAVYLYNTSPTNELAYCDRCLPRFLYPYRDANQLRKAEPPLPKQVVETPPTVEVVDEPEEPVVAPPAKKTSKSTK